MAGVASRRNRRDVGNTEEVVSVEPSCRDVNANTEGHCSAERVGSPGVGSHGWRRRQPARSPAPPLGTRLQELGATSIAAHPSRAAPEACGARKLTRRPGTGLGSSWTVGIAEACAVGGCTVLISCGADPVRDQVGVHGLADSAGARPVVRRTYSSRTADVA